MAMDTVIKEFKFVIRSMNWYLKRNKQYEADQLATWVKHNSNTNSTIKTAITNFTTLEHLVTAVESYFTHLETNKVDLDTDDKYFLSSFENLELFMINDTLCQLQKKLILQEEVVTNFNRMNINVNVTISDLDGTEEDLEDWFDNFDRIANSNGWTNEVKAFKLPCYLKDTTLLIWQNCTATDKKDYMALKKNILSKLMPVESCEFLFYSRKQKTAKSTIEFSLKLEKLAKKAFGAIDKEKDILKIFWEGLKFEIQKLLITATPKNMVEAVILAQRAEKLLSKETISQQNIRTVEEKTINALQKRESRSPSRSVSPNKDSPRERSTLCIHNNLLLENATTAIEWVI